MRLVLDTNTVISGLLWQGPPGQLLDAVQSGRVSLYTSVPLLTELQGVLKRDKFARQLKKRGLKDSAIFDGYATMAALVTPPTIVPAITRDPADDAVLACAAAAQADLIVSGDKDLLRLKEYQGIRIVNAAEAMRLMVK